MSNFQIGCIVAGAIVFVLLFVFCLPMGGVPGICRPPPPALEDSAQFRILKDGFGKFFVQERRGESFSTYWGHVLGSASSGYDKIEHAEACIREMLEWRTKSIQKVVAYYV